jgi:Protein of unknown function (DUF3306)
MNDPDNFLKRWSRRKRENDADNSAAVKSGARVDDPAAPPEGQSSAAKEDAGHPAEFDVASLPPIESIGSGTDISAFLQNGVPTALRHAALRRAWTTDPAIRDYIGPNENFWDAAGPDGIPGFGELDPGLDVKRMVSELFGEVAPDKPPAEQQDSAGALTQSDENQKTPADHSTTVEAMPSASQHSEIAATQKPPEEPPVQKMTRRHGGALPE